MTYECREVPLDEDDPRAAARGIIEMMDMDLPVDSLEALLRQTRHAHRMVLSEWLRRNNPDWQPPRRLKDNVDPDGPDYDYGEDTGAGLPTWQAWWRENWGRPPGNPGLFRGTKIPMPPLLAIYRLVNRFCRVKMGLPFNPDFTGRHAADTDLERFPYFNLAAQIFLLIAQDADPRYTSELCERVHILYYRTLNTSFR